MGTRSHGKTTTMEVIACPFSITLIKAGIRRCLQMHGEWERITQNLNPEQYLSELIDEMFQEAEEFAIGDIVEYRGSFEKRTGVNVPF